MIALAGKKDFGVIAMKTMGGVGRAAEDKKFQALLAEPRFKGSTPGAAMVKWLMSNPNLTAAVIATSNFDQLQENFGAAQQSARRFQRPRNARPAGGLQQGTDLPALRRLRVALPRAYRHCRHPALRTVRLDYHDLARARAEYQTLTKNGTACIACGDCLPGCPADINILAKLKEVHRLLG